MKSLLIAILLTLAFAGTTLGQSIRDAIAKVRQIKLLESTRDDVQRILTGYEANEGNDHYQPFWNDDLMITILYSSGTCSKDSDEDGASEIWNVKEWVVTKVEIEPSVPTTLATAGMDLPAFKKEPRYHDSKNFLVFHDKAAGLAVKTDHEDIDTIIFFPPKASSKKLCRNNLAVRGFYARKGWYSQAKPEDGSGDQDFPASVTGLNLSAVEIDLSSTTTVSVNTAAIDAENDVLTYNYTVSAGKIIGTGPNVTWDLTGVSPGTYTITAGVDDGCGICGKTMTKTVVVK